MLDLYPSDHRLARRAFSLAAAVAVLVAWAVVSCQGSVGSPERAGTRVPGIASHL